MSRNQEKILADAKELEILCKPLVEYMNKRYSPHDTLIITGEYVKIVQDKIGIPFNEFE